jgi:hypothetical protein
VLAGDSNITPFYRAIAATCALGLLLTLQDFSLVSAISRIAFADLGHPVEANEVRSRIHGERSPD